MAVAAQSIPLQPIPTARLVGSETTSATVPRVPTPGPWSARWGRIPRAVLDAAARGAIHGAAVSVYAALATHANGHGRCWPKVATIAATAGLSERWTQHMLRDLESAGLVARVDHLAGGHCSTGYRLPGLTQTVHPRGELQITPQENRGPLRGRMKAAPSGPADQEKEPARPAVWEPPVGEGVAPERQVELFGLVRAHLPRSTARSLLLAPGTTPDDSEGEEPCMCSSQQQARALTPPCPPSGARTDDRRRRAARSRRRAGSAEQETPSTR